MQLLIIWNFSSLDFVLVVAKLAYAKSFAYYAEKFPYHPGIMLYAFQPLLCLSVMTRHNGHRPITVCKNSIWSEANKKPLDFISE